MTGSHGDRRPYPEPDPYTGLRDEAFARWAARRRLEEHERRRRDREMATWVGTLRDHCEQRVPVVVAVGDGGRHHGRILAVARDHVVLRSRGLTVVLAGSHVRWLQSAGGGPHGEPDASDPREPQRTIGASGATGARGVTQDRTLLETLDALAAHAWPVSVVVSGVSDRLTGELVAVGEDVVGIRTGHTRLVAHVPVAMVAEVHVPDPSVPR